MPRAVQCLRPPFPHVGGLAALVPDVMSGAGCVELGLPPRAPPTCAPRKGAAWRRRRGGGVGAPGAPGAPLCWCVEPPHPPPPQCGVWGVRGGGPGASGARTPTATASGPRQAPPPAPWSPRPPTSRRPTHHQLPGQHPPLAPATTDHRGVGAPEAVTPRVWGSLRPAGRPPRPPGPHAHRNTARQAMDGLWTEARGQQKQSNDPGNNQHSPNTPTTGLRERGNEHQQEHRPQRPTESSDPTQHAKGRTGDCPGPRKETTTQENVTRGDRRRLSLRESGGVSGRRVDPPRPPLTRPRPHQSNPPSCTTLHLQSHQAPPTHPRDFRTEPLEPRL